MTNRADAARKRQVSQYVARLTREERMLLVLKRELYQDSWDDMTADLRARLEGRPFIFKLVNRISEDLARIQRLRAFEDEYGVNLSDHVSIET